MYMIHSATLKYTEATLQVWVEAPGVLVVDYMMGCRDVADHHEIFTNRNVCNSFFINAFFSSKEGISDLESLESQTNLDPDIVQAIKKGIDLHNKATSR